VYIQQATERGGLVGEIFKVMISSLEVADTMVKASQSWIAEVSKIVPLAER